MELDPEKMLIDLSQGTEPDPEELEHLLEVLAAVDTATLGRLPSVDLIYSYLVVIGKLKRREHAPVLERYLEAEDGLTVSLVLETLCLEWGLADDCLEHVLKFALGVSWDEDNDVRETALKILGEYLYGVHEAGQKMSQRQLRVIELLYATFTDPENDDWTRQISYYSLCRAWGLKSEELPSDCIALNLSAGSKDINWNLIGEIQAAVQGLE